MADTVVSDAARYPQDEGYANIADGNETWGSAGHLGLLATATANGPFVYDGLGFSAHDATNDTVDVGPGIAVLDMSQGAGVSTQSALGGSSAPSYDTSLSRAGAVVVELPTATTVGVVDTQLNPIWVAYATDSSVSGVSPGDVYLRHENGGGVSAPPHPSIKLGETNPDDSTQDFRAGYDNPPNEAGWREDPNSPWEGMSGSNFALTLAGRYDEVRVAGTGWTDRAQDTGFNFRIAGDTATEYSTYFKGDTSRTGLDSWRTTFVTQASGVDADGTVAGTFSYRIDGRWNNDGPQPGIQREYTTMSSTGGGIHPYTSGEYNGTATSPLNEINILPTNTLGYEIHVYGRHTSRPNVG